MTMRDISESPVSVKILALCLIFVASGTWGVAFTFYEQKNALMRVSEQLVILSAKLDRSERNSWTYHEAKVTFDRLASMNPNLKVPDIRSIRNDNQ